MLAHSHNSFHSVIHVPQQDYICIARQRIVIMARRQPCDIFAMSLSVYANAGLDATLT